MLRHGRPVAAIAISPDGKLLASAGWDKCVRIWELASGKELQQLQGQKESLQAQVDAGNRPGGNAGGDTGKPTKPGTGDKSPKHDVTRIEVAGDVLFDPGSVVIKAGGKKELDKIASQIKKKYPSNRIRVEGYTDSDPVNKVKDKFPNNKALSTARAEAVEKYLATKGISASRISAMGMGEANPKATKAASRRVEIVILGG